MRGRAPSPRIAAACGHRPLGVGKKVTRRMTWSIVARDVTGALGVIVASRFFAVGALCPHAHAGVGALSTQALVNPLYGQRGLSLLAHGNSPADVVRQLIAADPGREHRQLHVIDVEGTIAAHTGVECIEWCGHVTGDGFSVAGNMLTGPEVIEDTAQAYADADLIVARAGASTVTEIAAVGAAALFVPFPSAVDDHQTTNARFLVDAGGGWLVQQTELTPELLAELLKNTGRAALLERAVKAKTMQKTEAVDVVVRACEELASGGRS